MHEKVIFKSIKELRLERNLMNLIIKVYGWDIILESCDGSHVMRILSAYGTFHENKTRVL